MAEQFSCSRNALEQVRQHGQSTSRSTQAEMANEISTPAASSPANMGGNDMPVVQASSTTTTTNNNNNNDDGNIQQHTTTYNNDDDNNRDSVPGASILRCLQLRMQCLSRLPTLFTGANSTGTNQWTLIPCHLPSCVEDHAHHTVWSVTPQSGSPRRLPIGCQSSIYLCILSYMDFQVLVKPWPSSAILVSSRRCKLAIAILKPGRSGEAWFTRLCRAMVVEDLPSGRYLLFERCTGCLSAFLLLTVTFAHFGISIAEVCVHTHEKAKPYDFDSCQFQRQCSVGCMKQRLLSQGKDAESLPSCLQA